jgi:hypothetical protein
MNRNTPGWHPSAFRPARGGIAVRIQFSCKRAAGRGRMSTETRQFQAVSSFSIMRRSLRKAMF